MNASPSLPPRHSPSKPLPALAVLESAPAAPRRVLRAVDRSGEEFYFLPDQVASIAPVRDGACCVRLRAGRLILLTITSRAAAEFVWGKAA